MVVDYSQTINRYTHLDAYPLPRIDEMVEKVASYHIFSTIDLRSAYHQIPIRKNDRPYTAFEADRRLYQFKRIPFGVTNGVACFQRVMDDIITRENLADTFIYVDNITVCGATQAQHDKNLDRFLAVARKYNLTLNYDKCSFSAKTIDLLGYTIAGGTIRPDLERLRPLRELPPPHDLPSLRRAVGMFAYYAKWIPRYSEKIRSLVQCKEFPLDAAVVKVFSELKNDIANSVVRTIDSSLPLVVETDASEFAIAATLNQSGRPVAFFARTLSSSEQRHSSVEKEAYAIVEALRKWRHYLLGNHFTVITDQKSVAFMFDGKNQNKIKNEKIMRWRIDLSCFAFNIVYRPGKDNSAADSLSRIRCAAVGRSLYDLHASLCHPGVTRMAHYVRTHNLPHSVDEIKRTCSSCPVCAELKPRYYDAPQGTLVKATTPFERLNIDFKGPLPTDSGNKYILTIVDEFSRFPFAFPCPDTTSNTVVRCLTDLFALFGRPSYIHTDRGSSFMSAELKQFLLGLGIASSRTTGYNPQGNGQVERYNGIIWKAVTLTLKTRGLEPEQWELVLSDALSSIRALLCTAINATPHERMFSHPRRHTGDYSRPAL